MTDADHTYATRFRIPRRMWEAYGTLADREGTDRTALLLGHIRDDIQTRGTAEERAALEQAEQEMAERRARKGGRPPRTAPSSAPGDAPSDPA